VSVPLAKFQIQNQLGHLMFAYLTMFEIWVLGSWILSYMFGTGDFLNTVMNDALALPSKAKDHSLA